MGSNVRIKFVLVTLLCFTHLAIGKVIKRTGTQLSDSGNDADLKINQNVVIKHEKCQAIPESILSAILGPAFNARYMSIDDPRDNGVESEFTVSRKIKRKTSKIPSFSVDKEFNSVFSNDPAWDFEFTNIKYEHKLATESEEDRVLAKIQKDTLGFVTTRDIRGVKSTPWQCEAQVEWIDLGYDYFPRFLRRVECVRSNCWYGFYTCKPRSFTVKLLRRRNGFCIPSPSKNGMLSTSKFGVAGLPNELKELWVWEERAVNFCCECSAGS